MRKDFASLRAALEQLANGGASEDRHRHMKLRLFFDHVDQYSAARVVDRVRRLYPGLAP